MLYLWQGNKDTLYRILGTNEPWTIGQNVSSGCIRLTNHDIADLYNRTQSVRRFLFWLLRITRPAPRRLFLRRSARSCCTLMRAEQRHTAS